MNVTLVKHSPAAVKKGIEQINRQFFCGDDFTAQLLCVAADWKWNKNFACKEYFADGKVSLEDGRLTFHAIREPEAGGRRILFTEFRKIMKSGNAGRTRPMPASGRTRFAPFPSAISEFLLISSLWRYAYWFKCRFEVGKIPAVFRFFFRQRAATGNDDENFTSGVFEKNFRQRAVFAEKGHGVGKPASWLENRQEESPVKKKLFRDR